MLASHPKIDLPILHLVGEEADKLGLECYVIGGYVRDISFIATVPTLM